MISIIIPTYEHAKQIERCLQNIFKQTERDFEIIVVNDGSTDETVEVLAAYGNKIKVISQENRGANAARNVGFALAQGEYLLFCDADVVMAPRMLQKMAEALQREPATSYAYSSFKFGWKLFRLWPFDAQKLRRMNYIHTTSLLRREHFPGFDEDIRRLQDWDLWLTMLEAGRTGIFVKEKLFDVIPHKGGMSTWVPSIVYKIPWQKIGLRIKTIEKFQAARNIIVKKHNLP